MEPVIGGYIGLIIIGLAVLLFIMWVFLPFAVFRIRKDIIGMREESELNLANIYRQVSNIAMHLERQNDMKETRGTWK